MKKNTEEQSDLSLKPDRNVDRQETEDEKLLCVSDSLGTLCGHRAGPPWFQPDTGTRQGQVISSQWQDSRLPAETPLFSLNFYPLSNQCSLTASLPGPVRVVEYKPLPPQGTAQQLGKMDK